MYEALKQARFCVRTNYLMAKHIAPFVKEQGLDSDWDFYDVLSVLTFGIVKNNPEKSTEELGELIEKCCGS